MQEINDSEFEEEINKHDKIVVDFYADWCAPCRAIAPMVEKLGSVVEVRKCNIENNPVACKQYGITKLPTIVLFEHGKESKRSIGIAQNLSEKLGL